MAEINVYTTTQCPYCVMIKDFLDEKDISFTEVNVEEKPELMQELVNKTGQMGVPQTEINGKWVIGFDPTSIMNAINES